MSKRLALILSLTLTACAPSGAWVKPGASQNDFSRDKYSCTQQAQQRVSSAYVGVYGGSASNNVITNPDIYNSCMNSNGWYLRSKKDTQRQLQAKAQVEQNIKESNDSCNKEEYKIIFAKTACRSDDLTLEQLSDPTKISPEDKPLFMGYYSYFSARYKRVVAAYRSAGDPVGLELANLGDRTYSKLEKNSLDLYEGKVSWGEYNKAKKELSSSSNEEIRTITGKK